MAGYALVSVNDKTGLDLLIGVFAKHKVEIIGSGGTAEAIRKLGHKVTDVSDYTRFSEMPGGLVKTLHPKIHAGILGDWKDEAQRKYLVENQVLPFDFVVVNLYPFADVARSKPYDLRNAVDNIDIGGVALVRAAAKGALLNQRVVPVTNPSQYGTVAKALEGKGHVGPELRLRLARDAFTLTAVYDAAIRDYLARAMK
jgi:phosphoribosylaminoimidazolecarboxamide formyltransferase/IMP cyclohydrolase